MTADDVREVLRTQLKATTQVRLAAELGISRRYLTDFLHGHRATPGEKMLHGLGMREVVSYEAASGQKVARHYTSCSKADG